jgi:hypothetical protein
MSSKSSNSAPPAGPRRAILAAAIAVAAIATMQSASAESRGSLLDLPQASVEAAPAAVVVSETPFQSSVQLTCNVNSTSCFGRLPPAKANEQLAIQFISCTASNGVDASLRYFNALVTDSKVTKQLGLHYLAPSYRSAEPPYDYIVSQPVVLTVGPTNILHLSVTSIGTVVNVQCGVSGVRQKLG